MGDKNHLHVCRHCGNVVGTSTLKGPRECFNCEGQEFSHYMSIPQSSPDE